MNEHQRRWQRAALDVLLDYAGKYNRGPWIPTREATAAIQQRGCTLQAASGSLRALRGVGLADSCTTREGGFWKATEAALRAHVLLERVVGPHPEAPE